MCANAFELHPLQISIPTFFTRVDILKVLKNTIRKAWNKIVEETDETLIDLINSTTEKLGGLKVEGNLAEEFLIENKNRFLLPETPETPQVQIRTPRTPKISVRSAANFSGKSIYSFDFLRNSYQVRSWKDLLMKLSLLISEKEGVNFEKVLSLKGKKRPYFIRDNNELRVPEEVGRTGIYAETNQSANSIVKLCYKMLNILGYLNSDINIRTS